MTERQDPDAAIEQLRDWLSRDGFSVRPVNDENNHRNVEFQRPGDLTYNLVHPNPEADFVLVGLGLPGKEFSEVLGRQPEAEREAFLNELRIGLLGLGVEFSGVDAPTETVQLFEPAYFDGLSKDRFMEKYRRVKNASYFLRWRFAQAFGGEAGGPGAQAGGESASYIQ